MFEKDVFYVDSVVAPSHHFQQSDSVAIISSLECSGEENNILDCAYDLMTLQCSNESAALQCIGMIRGSIGYNFFLVKIFRQVTFLL